MRRDLNDRRKGRFRAHGEYAGAHRERQIGIAKQLLGAMGI
jgi:hypothetical protein